jgi:hypothetical protein
VWDAIFISVWVFDIPSASAIKYALGAQATSATNPTMKINIIVFIMMISVLYYDYDRI